MDKKIGLVSDTHGAIRVEALEALKGCNMIIHAGDIGKSEVINSLEKIAPVHAIRGNIDKGKWAEEFPDTKAVKIGNLDIYVIHDIKNIDIDPKKEGFDVVVYGHSHKHKKYIEDDVLYINPGGAGRRRFSLPLTLAILYISENSRTVEFINIGKK